MSSLLPAHTRFLLILSLPLLASACLPKTEASGTKLDAGTEPGEGDTLVIHGGPGTSTSSEDTDPESPQTNEATAPDAEAPDAKEIPLEPLDALVAAVDTAQACDRDPMTTTTITVEAEGEPTEVGIDYTRLPEVLAALSPCALEEVVTLGLAEQTFSLVGYVLENINAEASFRNCAQAELGGFVADLGCNRDDAPFREGLMLFGVGDDYCNPLSFDFHTIEKNGDSYWRSTDSEQAFDEHILIEYEGSLESEQHLRVSYEDLRLGTARRSGDGQLANANHPGDYNDISFTLVFPPGFRFSVGAGQISTCGSAQLCEGGDVFYTPPSDVIPPETPAGAIIGSLSDDVLTGDEADDHLLGCTEDNLLKGDPSDDVGGNDCLYGGDHNDHLEGNAGNDVLLAGIGDDVLEGGNGDDYLDGGPGDDTLSGDAASGTQGSDTFVLGPELGFDTITDFKPNIDHIALRGVTAEDLFLRHDFSDILLGVKGELPFVRLKNTFISIIGQLSFVEAQTPDACLSAEEADAICHATYPEPRCITCPEGYRPSADRTYCEQEPKVALACGTLLAGPFKRTEVLYGTDGDDTLVYKEDGGYELNGRRVTLKDVQGIDLGAGNDLLLSENTAWPPPTRPVIRMGEGEDRIEHARLYANCTDLGPGSDGILGVQVAVSQIFAGDGNDNLDFFELGSSFVFGGNGEDTVQTRSSSSSFRFYGEDGVDRLIIGQPGDENLDFSQRNKSFLFYGGKGNDVLTAYAPTLQFYFFGDDGNDTLTTFGRAIQFNYRGGKGSDLAQIYGYSSQFDFFGEQDADTLVIKNTAQQFLYDGGTGIDAVFQHGPVILPRYSSVESFQ